MVKVKAIGERGSWFAKVDGERLPCVHQYWVKGLHHCDPGFGSGERQWDELFRSIVELKRVILTKDEPIAAPDRKSGFLFNRTGYIAVYSVANIEADDRGLRFDLTGRLCDLQG